VRTHFTNRFLVGHAYAIISAIECKGTMLSSVSYALYWTDVSQENDSSKCEIHGEMGSGLAGGATGPKSGRRSGSKRCQSSITSLATTESS
jgi:hypothetical protein